MELALLALAIRDGYAPPTMNTTEQESFGNLDCLIGQGSALTIDRGMKLSLAFGGHLVGIALARPTEAARPACPLVSDALVRDRGAQGSPGNSTTEQTPIAAKQSAAA
jgi:hypothetical protein